MNTTVPKQTDVKIGGGGGIVKKDGKPILILSKIF
jgi:hypothetical protein